MNRRGFLRRLATGAVATAALASIPAEAVTFFAPLREPGRLWACERLRAAYHAWLKSQPGRQPHRMIVGWDLFWLFEQELLPIERFTVAGETAPRRYGLLFKGAIVEPRGRGYDIIAIEG